MANFLSEMGGGLRCRDASGHYTPCPTGLSSSCGITGCMSGRRMGRIVPFDLPAIGGRVSLDMTDALAGALAGKAVLGVANSVMAQAAPDYAKHVEIGAGALAIGGLFMDSLRENSMFLGFAFPTIAEAAEPLTDMVADLLLKGVGAVTGKAYAPVATSAAVTGMRGIGSRRVNRIGQSQGATEIRASFQRPSDLIRAGSVLSGVRSKM